MLLLDLEAHPGLVGGFFAFGLETWPGIRLFRFGAGTHPSVRLLGFRDSPCGKVGSITGPGVSLLKLEYFLSSLMTP